MGPFKFSLKEIPLTHIKGPLFNIRFNRDDRPLETSIQNYGVFNPPRLVLKEGAYHALDGWARLTIAGTLGQAEAACFVHDDASFSVPDAFMLCLELNGWSRELNMVEKAMCVKLAHELYGGQKIPKTFWQRVGINENIRAIHQNKELLKLPPSVLKYAVTNGIHLSVILGFLRFPTAGVERLASQLFVMPLNQNKLAEILGLLIDISKREELSPAKIMDQTLEDLRGEGAMQKESKLRRLLHKRRNPHYESQLADFERKVKDIPLNAEAKIAPAPFFEDDYVELTAKLRSQDDILELKNTLSNENWDELFKK